MRWISSGLSFEQGPVKILIAATHGIESEVPFRETTGVAA
jgi:hypothetical protein